MLYSISQIAPANFITKKDLNMRLHDELYFEITAEGSRGELERFSAFLTSGVLNDFFEVDEDYIIPDDDYNTVMDSEKTSLVFTNDEYAIEINSFDPEAFLEVLCKGGKGLYLTGQLFDCDDVEYRFVSNEGDSFFIDADKVNLFNDELDAKALEEEEAEEKDELDF